MQTALGILFLIAFLIVVTWIAIFGCIGALLARARGGAAGMGFACGMFLGPVGWALIWVVTRRQAALIASH